ncbi:hypothetical protein CLF_112778 [Clonorchis sinensis]|uniref:Uncharacterized protein n=1 Tax=Clonorchis sinensis TaxID=79923 RepID=G7YWZ2_CLOSI|nr:hypothetical protein CLF_112778 [Clonorchis sinensis]
MHLFWTPAYVPTNYGTDHGDEFCRDPPNFIQHAQTSHRAGDMKVRIEQLSDDEHRSGEGKFARDSSFGKEASYLVRIPSPDMFNDGGAAFVRLLQVRCIAYIGKTGKTCSAFFQMNHSWGRRDTRVSEGNSGQRYTTTDAVARWTQFTHHYVQRNNSSTGILERSQVSDSQTKKQGTAGSRINKGHKPEPREVNDRGHPSIDQNTRAREARPTTHVVIDQSGHGITEQPMKLTDRTTNRDRRSTPANNMHINTHATLLNAQPLTHRYAPPRSLPTHC